MTGEHVNPVADFEPAHQRQDLVSGEVEGVEDEAELGMLDQGKEAESAVEAPLHPDSFAAQEHVCFNEGGELAHRHYLPAGFLEEGAVGLPG